MSVEDIAAAMYRYSDDERLRAQMIERGKQRARAFKWEVSAQKLLEVFEEIQSPP